MPKKGTVIIMSGASGAGKTSYIKNNLSNAVVCSADHYFNKTGIYKFDPNKLKNAHEECLTNFIDALRNNQKLIVVDNTNTKNWEIKPYVEVAKKYDYEVKVIRMITPLKTLMGRNIHGVPDSKVEQMFNRMEKIPNSWDIEEILIDGSK